MTQHLNQRKNTGGLKKAFRKPKQDTDNNDNNNKIIELNVGRT